MIDNTRWIVGAIVLILLAQAGQAQTTSDRRAQECLGLAIYWEARGEGARGMRAVGSVVLNRVASKQFPDNVCAVVYQGGETPPCQFSWWCDGKSDRPRHKGQWQTALTTASELLARNAKDPTRGALYFHSTSIRPTWHSKLKRTVKIGNHIFYR